ncbi:MAG: hypothetical protein IT373_03190 [Polyangiaceae bacterium]|nr:hypothetical protein [Polyangiaceae bacterium]
MTGWARAPSCGRRRAVGCAAALVFACVAACGTPAAEPRPALAPPAHEVEVLIAPAADTPLAELPPADDASEDVPGRGALPVARAQFIGVWEDRNTAGMTHFRVVARGGVPTVTSAVESTGDLEHFVVRSSTFVGGELRWKYFVPSTGYTVEMWSRGAGVDTMETSWSNSGGASGEESLLRVADDGAPAPRPRR